MLLKTVSNLMADLNVVSNLEYFMLPRTSSHIFGAKNAVRHGRQMRMRESQIVWTQNGWSQMIHEGTEDTQETKTQNSNSAGHLRRVCCMPLNLLDWITDNTEKREKQTRRNSDFWYLLECICVHMQRKSSIVHEMIFEIILKHSLLTYQLPNLYSVSLPNDIVPKNKNLVDCLSDDINFETWEKLADMGMLKLLFYMAIQNKIKPTDHARDKFSNVYVLCKDHLKWFYSTSKPLTFMQYFCSNLCKILPFEWDSNFGHANVF